MSYVAGTNVKDAKVRRTNQDIGTETEIGGRERERREEWMSKILYFIYYYIMIPNRRIKNSMEG